VYHYSPTLLNSSLLYSHQHPLYAHPSHIHSPLFTPAIRPDGRALSNARKTTITFEETWGVARVCVGNTQVLTTISSDVLEPSPDRGSEGLIKFNVSFPPMASPFFQAGAKTAQATEISRIIERCIKDTHCVDLETLCIIPKERVWALNVDIRVINYDGNIIDAATLATLAALMYYRRPEVSVTQEGVHIHSETEKNFVPLQLNCVPITTTFALFNHAATDTYKKRAITHLPVVLDPGLLEDLCCDGMLTIASTPDQEILCINATGSQGYNTEFIIQNSELSVQRAIALNVMLKNGLDAALKKKQHKIW
jgi:exosome complex component RRP45